MINLIVAAALSCPVIKIINHTKEWTQKDKSTLASAKIRCGEIYPDSPCVKVFIKKEELLYNVVCGG